jgi:cell division initiation protein
MRITPIEIRQKEFEKKLRGYDKDDVNAFLKTLSSEWERIVDENKEMKIKLEQSEKEVMKLREVESSLFRRSRQLRILALIWLIKQIRRLSFI